MRIPLKFTLFFTLSVLMLGASVSTAQRVTLSVSHSIAEAPPDGYLADTYGRTLYIQTTQQGKDVDCDDACLLEWPPLRTSNSVRTGTGVDEDLVGVVDLTDGTSQVTYAGWRLYYNAKDARAGDYYGQGANDTWYLVSPGGDALVSISQPTLPEVAEVDEVPEEEEPAPTATTEIDPEVLALGQTAFSTVCAACHGANGEGGVGVRFVGNAHLEDTHHVLDMILHGGGYMPAIGSNQPDDWVAAAATYVRNSWGNSYGPVSIEEVEAIR